MKKLTTIMLQSFDMPFVTAVSTTNGKSTWATWSNVWVAEAHHMNKQNRPQKDDSENDTDHSSNQLSAQKAATCPENQSARALAHSLLNEKAGIKENQLSE